MTEQKNISAAQQKVSAAVTLLADAMVLLDGEHEPPADKPPEPEPLPQIPITDIAGWQKRMQTGGTLGKALLDVPIPGGSADAGYKRTYYDAAYVFTRIAQFTGNDFYARVAKAANYWYGERGVLAEPIMGRQGYDVFSRGLAHDWLENKNEKSRDAVICLATRASYSGGYKAGTHTGISRDVAYALIAAVDWRLCTGNPPTIIPEFIKGEKENYDFEAGMISLLDSALAHVDKWVTGTHDEGNWAPFMIGLTCSALIYYWENWDKNPQILPRVQQACDFVWDNAWIEADQAFFYRLGSRTGAPDLNNLVAPAFGWLWSQTRDEKYLIRGDQIFAGAHRAYLGTLKHFCQHFFTSFDYVRFRGGPSVRG